MTKHRILYVGIASREAIKRRTIAIAKGELRPGPKEPKVWFTSFESLGKVLSERNMLLLEMIRSRHPRSVSDLANLSGRKKSNLSRTLANMERLGLVQLKTEKNRKVPRVKFDRLMFDYALDQAA